MKYLPQVNCLFLFKHDTQHQQTDQHCLHKATKFHNSEFTQMQTRQFS